MTEFPQHTHLALSFSWSAAGSATNSVEKPLPLSEPQFLHLGHWAKGQRPGEERAALQANAFGEVTQLHEVALGLGVVCARHPRAVVLWVLSGCCLSCKEVGEGPEGAQVGDLGPEQTAGPGIQDQR